MINVDFYTFSKRKNSTAIPTGAAYTVPVLLKDSCSQESPVLQIHSASFSTFANYNYCYIAFFRRYYFIDSKEVHTGSEIWFYLKEDYLASFKSAIQAQTGVYIEYSSTPSTYLIDSRIQRLTRPVVTESYAALPNTTFTENGCVIMSTTGNKCTGSFILSNASDIYTILDGVDWTTQTITGTTIEEITLSGMQNMIGGMEQFFTKDSASRNIRNAMTLPWVAHGSAIGPAVTNYVIGSFPTGETVYRVADKVVVDSVNLTIPWQNTDWRRSGANCQIYMYAPLFGVISLPTDSLASDSSINTQYAFSYENGDVAMRVKGVTSQQIITTMSTNVASSVGVGASNISNNKITSGVTASIAGLGTIVAASSGVGLLAGILGTAAGGLSLIDAMGGSTTSGGGLGGFACCALDKVCHIWCVGAQTSDTPQNMASAYGYPTFAVGSLAGKTGFTKLREAVFNGAGTGTENDAITTYLNQGFYIE